MSLRPSRSVFGVGSARRATQTALREPELAPRPDLRVLEGGADRKEQAQSFRLGRKGIIASVSALCLVLFGVVAFHVVLSQGQFKLEKAENRAVEEQAQYERWRLQVAQLESPQRITDEATNRLGMVAADKVTAVTPRTDDVSPAQTSGGQTATGPVRNDNTTADGDPSRAAAWAELKPHLSSASK